MPRLYTGGRGYGDPQVAAAAMVTALEFVTDSPDKTLLAISHACSKLLPRNVPTMFIARELAEAAIRTAPPPNLLWREIKLFYDSAILMLPSGWIEHTEYGSCGFIGFARFLKGETFDHVGTGKSAFDDDQFIIFTGFDEQEGFPLLDCGLDSRQPQLDYKYLLGNEKPYSLDGTMFDTGAPVNLSDNEFLSMAVCLTFSLLLIISVRKHLIYRFDRGNSTKRKKNGKKVHRPNVIGKNFRVRTQSQSPSGKQSKYLHWRRGHFRQQRSGENLADSKIIWIEPMLVGFDNRPNL